MMCQMSEINIFNDDLENQLRSLEKHKASAPIRESVIRKFVASNPKNYRAKIILLNIIARNQNWRELIRLSVKIGQEFENKIEPIFWTATGLANMLKIEQALALLQKDKIKVLNAPEIVSLTAELHLVNKPAYAVDILRKKIEVSSSSTHDQLGLKSAQSLLKSRAGAEVVFFLASTWHISIQQRIFDELTSRNIGCVMTHNVWLLQALHPKVVVLSDISSEYVSRIRYTLPNTYIVNTRHGLGDKNYAYYASAVVDYVCASSEYVAREQIAAGCLNPNSVWITGFPQMDSLFQMVKKSKYNPVARKPHILFAPTFTNGLNSGELIGNDPIAMIRGSQSDWHVTVRPHPHMVKTHPRLVDAWRHSIASSKNAELDLTVEQDPADLLYRSDILISDVSSIALQFLSLDRPIVCLMEDELAKRSPYFTSESYEARLGDASLKINKVYELNAAIKISLAGKQSDSIVLKRRALARDLFGTFNDGRAGLRIAEKIEHIL